MNGLRNNEPREALADFLPDGINIKKILIELYQYINYILIIAVCGGLIAFLYTFTLSPQYQTTAMLKLRLDQASSPDLMNKFGFHGEGSSKIDVQEALIRTRFILEPVIIRSSMNVSAYPDYFPFFGAWYANQHTSKKLANPFLGLKKYAWGGEHIEVAKFSVESAFENSPFKIIAGNAGTYKLYTQKGEFILEGKVGKEYSNQDKTIKIKLSQFIARPGTQFTVIQSSPLNLISKLARMIQITNIYGNDPTQTTGIFQIQLTDSNPLSARQILNAIIDCVIEKNVKDKTSETQRSLDFLNKRLPELKESLAKAEDAINQYHIKNNTLSMAMTSQLLGRELTLLEQLLGELKTRHRELLQEYTEEHPLVISTMNKEKEVESHLNEVKNRIRHFPITYQKEINLQREIKIKNTLYLSMLSEKERLQVSNSRFASDITVLSDAMPARKIEPSKLLITLFGFLFSAFLSCVIILLKKAMRAKFIEGAEQIESEFNISVKAILPFSKRQNELDKIDFSSTFGSSISAPLILARHEPNDLIIESLRNLRINLQLMDSLDNASLITITGSSSGSGKSFVSANFAQIIADSGQRTLIMDADLRKGHLHHCLQQSRTNGLSEYLENKCKLDNVIRSLDSNLYFMPCGKYTNHPLHLFQSQQFKDLLEKLKLMFDKIIIDTPPILPVLDSVLIAKHCDIKLFVACVGEDSFFDLRDAFKKFLSYHIEFNGIILNHKSPAFSSMRNKHFNYNYGVSA